MQSDYRSVPHVKLGNFSLFLDSVPVFRSCIQKFMHAIAVIGRKTWRMLRGTAHRVLAAVEAEVTYREHLYPLCLEIYL